MSAITFPNSPSPGAQTTVNGITYTFTDGTWVAVGQSNFYSLPIASPTVLGGIKGGGTDITVANDGVISFSGTLPGPKTFTFTVTGNGQTTVNDPQTGLNGAVGDYTITGNDRRGIVSGTNPTIHINEEDTIIFNVTAAGQEFRLVWATAAPTSGPNVGGFEDIGTNSVSTNEATGQGSGTVTWVSKEQDGDSLYQGGSNYYYQDCDQNFTNNPTTYKFGTIKVFHKDTPEGKGDWLELNDTPNSFSGQAGKFTKVNAGENALEFTDSTIQIATSTVLGGVKSGGTGIQIAADGVISIATGSTFDTNDVDSHINKSSANANEVLSWNGTDYAWDNVRSLPVNTQAAAYTIQASDTGKMVKASGNITVSSANQLSEGDIVTIYNATASNISIERSSVDMYLVGDSTSQNRTLAQKGIATLVCVGTNEYVVMGGGIT
jgi:hypothetical protein